MGKEIDLDIRFWAEELYIVDGLTFEEVSEKTGVSVSQLKRWASGEGLPRRSAPRNDTANVPAEGREELSWSDRRREFRNAASCIRRDTMLLRKRLLQKALRSLNPQDVYAISSIEAVAARASSHAQDDAPAAGPEEITAIKTPQEAIAALQTVIEKKINIMLSQPGSIDLSGIKQMKQALELIEKMREKYKDKEKDDDDRVMDSETIRQIREQLGL